MDKKESQSHGLSNGFLLGVIIGVLITLLLTTKRGKKILKMITEEGMSRFSNLDDMFSDAMEERREKPVEPKLPPVTLAQAEIEDDEVEDEIAKALEEHEHVQHVVKAKPKHEEPKTATKRFFKGIPRRSVN